jgi:hypothetical protein
MGGGIDSVIVERSIPSKVACPFAPRPQPGAEVMEKG